MSLPLTPSKLLIGSSEGRYYDFRSSACVKVSLDMKLLESLLEVLLLAVLRTGVSRG